MNLSEYKEQVGRIPYGKRLPSALYVHREGLAGLGGTLGALLDQVVAKYQVSPEFNLVKFRTDELKLSFLAYPEFESDPHPALKHAITIDLATGKARHTDYAANANPPILHRKETFLPPGHPFRAQFEALSRAEDEAGLYENPATIGFKLNWERLLESRGLLINGHTLMNRSQPLTAQPDLPPFDRATASVPEGHPTIAQRFNVAEQDPQNSSRAQPSPPRLVPEGHSTIAQRLNVGEDVPQRITSPEGTTDTAAAAAPSRPPGQTIVVARYRTALTRYELSKPVKSLLEYGVLRSGMTLFDYGCGQDCERGLTSSIWTSSTVQSSSGWSS